MPVATRTDTSLSATITQANLTTALKTAMTNAGFSSTPYGEQAASTNKVIYQVVFDASKAKGTAYVELSITSGLVVSIKISDNYTLASYSATNQSVAYSGSVFTPTTGSSVNLIAINHAELRGVILNQSSQWNFIGYLRPGNKPSWWDENSYLYCFNSVIETLAYYGLCAPNPYNNQTSATYALYLQSSSLLANANPITNKRDLVSKPFLFGPATYNYGVVGQLSADLVQCAATGLSRLDLMQVTAGSEEYLLLNNSSSGLAIRVV